MTTEEFENLCADYLNRQYGNTGCKFYAIGGSDSTKQDIIVKKNGKELFSIEVKEPLAQCGQFVVFPDTAKKSFYYSESNHPSTPSKESTRIIERMIADYENCKKPSARELGFGEEIYKRWVVDYYVNYKKATFFITREHVDFGCFIIFPTEEISNYFDITACYRKKKSGSHNPNHKELESLPTLLPSQIVCGYDIEKDGKYTNVLMEPPYDGTFIREEPFRTQFKPIGYHKYRMTVLGTTNNPNVIFTIQLSGQQRKTDLEAFEKSLQEL